MSLKPFIDMLSIIASCTLLEHVGGHLDAAGLRRVFAKAGCRDSDRQDRCDERLAKTLRDLHAAVARQDRVAASSVVRAALFRAAGDDQDRRESLVVDLVVELRCA